MTKETEAQRQVRALRNAGRPDLTGEQLGEAVKVFEKAAGVGHGYEDKPKSDEVAADTPDAKG